MKTIYRAYKTELDPNNVQRTLLQKHANVARFAWNWALARVKAKASKPNAIALSRELNAIKKTNFPWMYEVSKCAPQEAMRSLQTTFSNFFKKNKSDKKSGRQVGFPKFKSRRKNKHSFKLYGAINVEDKQIRLPKLGWLQLKEHGYLPKNSKILSATCSKHADKWFVSVNVKEESKQSVGEQSRVLGIDLGIKTLATCSEGTRFENPKALGNKQRQLKKLQKRFSRQQRGSKRREKTRKRLARLHFRIGCVRKDAIHKATSWVAKTKRPTLVVLEDLNVLGMMKNHRLARSIGDASFHEFGRQLQYKQVWNGGAVLRADRFFPSSKTCSGCGCVKEELKLSERTFVCQSCGMSMDRDLNAAVNLEKFGLRSASSAANARGGAAAASNPCEARIKQEIHHAQAKRGLP